MARSQERCVRGCLSKHSWSEFMTSARKGLIEVSLDIGAPRQEIASTLSHPLTPASTVRMKNRRPLAPRVGTGPAVLMAII